MKQKSFNLQQLIETWSVNGLACVCAASLLAGFGCSKDESQVDPPAPAPGTSTGGPGGMSGGGEGSMGGMEETGPQPGGGVVAPAEPAGGTQRTGTDTNAPPVLAEMDGLFYEVYEIAKQPYTGKVVTYHATGVEKSEKVYKAGRLELLTEWHDNGQKSHEVKVAADGKRTEQFWNEKGEKTGAPVKVVTARARGLQFTFGLAGSRNGIELYRNQPEAIILRGFGEPDARDGTVWIYRKMKVQSGNTLMTTVRFTMSNGRVLSISVEP